MDIVIKSKKGKSVLKIDKTMKILWIANIPFPEPLEIINQPTIPYAGWLYALAEKLSNIEEISLSIAFPYKQEALLESYLGEKIRYFFLNNSKIIEAGSILLEEVNPDLVHIHGTEMSHSLYFQELCEKNNYKYVVSIQGLVSIIANHLFSNLNLSTIYGFNLIDIFFRNSLYLQKKNYLRRAKNEQKMLSKAPYVIGRTEFDKAITVQYNPNARYFHCNEILRDSFYEKSWDYAECRKNSIFVSQAQSPIKGFHFVVETVRILKDKYPNLIVYVSGETRIFDNRINSRLLRTRYESHIRSLIKKYNIGLNFKHVGKLSEIEMRNQYLKSNVFVSASTIENESNSVSEARLLGVPTVSSFVGGVYSRITHGKDGYLYPYDAPYMLAYYIDKLFSDQKLAKSISVHGRESAVLINNPTINTSALIDIYKMILE